MKSWSIKILLLVLVFQSLKGYTQNRKLEKDSIVLATISSDFFRWYISASSNHSNGECFPVFVQDKNGMTTLDYSKYIKNLKDLSFSDSLIAKEKSSYQVCIDNLAKVKYSDFLKFEDLDDFESRNCDFTNYYHWTGGQEMYEVYTVTRVKINKKDAAVIGFLFNPSGGRGIKGERR